MPVTWLQPCTLTAHTAPYNTRQNKMAVAMLVIINNLPTAISVVLERLAGHGESPRVYACMMLVPIDS